TGAALPAAALAGAALTGAAPFAGAGTTTSCRAPVLPSIMVIVVVLAGAPAAGGDAVVAAGPLCCWMASDETASCDTAATSDDFAAICRFAGTTPIGSPPNGSSATTAHNTNTPRNAASPPA